MLIKKILLPIFEFLGYNVKKINSLNPEENRIATTLKHLKISCLIDIGANVGQYAEKIIKAGYSGKIISFEPLTSAYSELKKKTEKNPMWIIAPRCAISNKTESGEINISLNSVSSSLNKILDNHVKAAPESKFVEKESVEIKKLDDFKSEYFNNGEKYFLKIDTQGQEFEVLEGAKNILPLLEGIQLELSFVPLYDGQKLFTEVKEYLEKIGFELWSIIPGFSDYKTGQMLQADAIFIKKQ